MSDLIAYISRLFGATTTNSALAGPAESLIDEPIGPRFRTDNDSSATVTLPDGRKLGYAQYGMLTGIPVFFLHGHPGSRLEAAGFDEVSKKSGARLIAVDRPGMGWSSPHPNRTILDHPKDIEHLADHLDLEQYSVLGISGGGPYALACAASMPPERLKCVSIVVGLGPPDIGMSGADFIHRVGFGGGYRYCPLWAVRWFWQRHPIGRLDLSDEERLKLMLKEPVTNEKDKAFIKTDWPRLTTKVTRECFSQGFESIAREGQLFCMNFGFRVEDIRHDLPVQLWYGMHDTFVPANHGVQIAARLGGRAQLHVEDETHASIVINRMKDILDGLVKDSQ